MIYVFCTLLRRDLPLPELLYTIYKLLLVVRFYFSLQVELEFTPQSFHGLKVRTLQGEYTTSWFFLVEESLHSPTRMLQVIILYELVLVTLIIIINRISIVSRTLQKRSAPMMPSKMQISVAPCLLIPPTHMNNGGEIEHSSLKIMCCVELTPDAWLCWCHESSGNKQPCCSHALVPWTNWREFHVLPAS